MLAIIPVELRAKSINSTIEVGSLSATTSTTPHHRLPDG